MRNCLHGLRLNTIADLVKILKKRHTTGKTYDYYNAKMSSMRMLKDESVDDFYDRVRTVRAGFRQLLPAVRTRIGRQGSVVRDRARHLH